MKKGEFTVEKVQGALRRIFGEKSKKEISGNMEKDSGISINNVRAKPVQKRKHARMTENECFYCFETGHYKADCPVMARDREPNREGGQLFRTDVKTAPGANKKARKAKQSAINTMKTIVEDGEKRLNEQGQTLLEEDVDYAEDVRCLAYEEGNVPMSDGEGQTPADLKQIEREVRRKHASYLSKLQRLTLSNDLWVVDTGAGHAVVSKYTDL
ncbi:hypothetical protein PR003_g3292 [Phytophthora rubi]|uniref:CCHC-type domain-containing protein n=1 Tax=Phytophthora rubi TaxID=129364 RepID=A0A6A3PBM6_9STRA|nr:hypothetical protein PR002_g3589 [Phytophthora rubi]KAE9050087.1 hypothetical protein PR001_g2720 [Phytophthora rubi]KAE9354598.1 hypothetical protein PR003_g3292 [Phytophthora rubi]